MSFSASRKYVTHLLEETIILGSKYIDTPMDLNNYFDEHLGSVLLILANIGDQFSI